MRKNPNLASISKTAFRKNVYEPAEDSFLLADTILADAEAWEENRKPRTCVEIGSGSGYVVCSVAKALGHKCQCFATDINPEACLATQETLRNHSMDTWVDVVQCDIVQPFLPRMLHGVDLVIFNPPYVVTPDQEVDLGGIAAAWAGGFRGRRVIDRVLDVLKDVVSSRGLVYMIAIHDNDPVEIIECMSSHSFTGSIIAKQSADEELLYVLKFVKNV